MKPYETCAKCARNFLATPPFTKPHPLNCREARQQPENVENQWNSNFCLYRQVCQSDFKLNHSKCMSDRGFLARRGVLELAMSIEACMLSWLEGGCLSTQSTPLDPPLQIGIDFMIDSREWKLWLERVSSYS